MINLRNNISFKALAFTPQDSQMLKEARQNHKLVAFDIDTQGDFIDLHTNPRDGLYVAQAETIKPNLQALTSAMEDLSIPKIVTMDTHRANDPEFKIFQAFSDQHCVKGTPGWEKIPETIDSRTNRIVDIDQSRQDTPSKADIESLVEEGKVLTIEKNTYDLTQHADDQGNFQEAPKAKAILQHLKEIGTQIAIVYGVATDYCVKAAVDALKKVGIKPIVVQDAIKHVAENGLDNPNDPTYKDVTVVSTQELMDALS